MPRIISTAPVRIADAGGWTDTWFAQHGAVCNIAVSPRVEVTVEIYPSRTGMQRIELDVRTFGDRYSYAAAEPPGRHPLLETAVETLRPREGTTLRITIDSTVPPGASTGTSASTTVALLAALHRVHGEVPAPMELAMEAHHIEMDLVGWQCGIQDQIAAAFGGVLFIDMFAFPRSRVTPLLLPGDLLAELERRLLLVYLGASHRSSDVHRMVIAELEGEGPSAPRLERLRSCATRARDALLTGDLRAYGRVLAENTEAQAALHPDLVSDTAYRVIETAKTLGAAGWKVNGAGGGGGSITVLCDAPPGARDALSLRLRETIPEIRPLPVRLSRQGVTVTAD
ncbi:MAG: GHMP kinase [Bacteroidota bacterium]|nr:GHMP kinase [Bacteroidota bacterium]